MKNIIYGWVSGKGEQLFVYQNGISWGVSRDCTQATKFNDIQDCIHHWLNKYSFPKGYECLLHEEHLKFFNAKTKQQILQITSKIN